MTYCSMRLRPAEETGVCLSAAPKRARTSASTFMSLVRRFSLRLSAPATQTPRSSGLFCAAEDLLCGEVLLFKGRASRSEFWYFILWLALFFLVLNLLGLAISFFSVRVFVAKGNENSFWF